MRATQAHPPAPMHARPACVHRLASARIARRNLQPFSYLRLDDDGRTMTWWRPDSTMQGTPARRDGTGTRSSEARAAAHRGFVVVSPDPRLVARNGPLSALHVSPPPLAIS